MCEKNSKNIENVAKVYHRSEKNTCKPFKVMKNSKKVLKIYQKFITIQKNTCKPYKFIRNSKISSDISSIYTKSVTYVTKL